MTFHTKGQGIKASSQMFTSQKSRLARGLESGADSTMPMPNTIHPRARNTTPMMREPASCVSYHTTQATSTPMRLSTEATMVKMRPSARLSRTGGAGSMPFSR